MHPLDNPVWHALVGPQRAFAQQTPLAVRYEPAVTAFAALPDHPTPEAWDALRALVGPDGVAVLFRDVVRAPAGWAELFRMPTVQMSGEDAARGDVAGCAELGLPDVADMLDLVRRTAPGPFGRRTNELGTYLGLREQGTLIAMAGERMRVAGHVEVSGVCTDPEHRGRGHASRLVRALVGRIRDAGDVPFLHVVVENAGAIRVYESLGFRTRRMFDVVGLRAPG